MCKQTPSLYNEGIGVLGSLRAIIKSQCRDSILDFSDQKHQILSAFAQVVVIEN